MRTFKNTILGETWFEVGEAPDWQRLYERRESYLVGEVPADVLFLTAGADVQHDRVEIDVWGWGRGLRSWLVKHIVVVGDPSKRELWVELEKVLVKTWRHANGATMRLAKFAIDTGDGRFTNTIYQWVRRQDQRLVMAIKGKASFDRAAPVSGPSYVEVNEGGRKIKRGAAIWTIAVSLFKAETYRWLRMAAPTDEEVEQGFRYPDGFVHLPRGLEDEWFKQLCSEQLVVIRDRRGFAKQQWQQLRDRNEALDCRVYARAAAWLMNADSWTDGKWKDLERQVAVTAAGQESAAAPAALGDDATAPVAGVVRRPMRRSRVR
jgi:phage terminase large subunit GpA-like protein